LLYAKYKTDCTEVEILLKEALYLGLPDATPVIEALSEDSLFRKIESIISYLEKLKSIMTSSENMMLLKI